MWALEGLEGRLLYRGRGIDLTAGMEWTRSARGAQSLRGVGTICAVLTARPRLSPLHSGLRVTQQPSSTAAARLLAALSCAQGTAEHGDTDPQYTGCWDGRVPSWGRGRPPGAKWVLFTTNLQGAGGLRGTPASQKAQGPKAPCVILPLRSSMQGSQPLLCCLGYVRCSINVLLKPDAGGSRL
jgi:hypothetical protein